MFHFKVGIRGFPLSECHSLTKKPVITVELLPAGGAWGRRQRPVGAEPGACGGGAGGDLRKIKMKMEG